MLSPSGVNFEEDLAVSNDINDKKVAAALRCARNSLLPTATLDFQRQLHYDENQNNGAVLERTAPVIVGALPIVSTETVEKAICAEFPNGGAPSLDEMVRSEPVVPEVPKTFGFGFDDYE